MLSEMRFHVLSKKKIELSGQLSFCARIILFLHLAIRSMCVMANGCNRKVTIKQQLSKEAMLLSLKVTVLECV